MLLCRTKHVQLHCILNQNKHNTCNNKIVKICTEDRQFLTSELIPLCWHLMACSQIGAFEQIYRNNSDCVTTSLIHNIANLLILWNCDYQHYFKYTSLFFYRTQVITARNEVGARLCFYRCVWFCSQGGGGVPDQVPPRDQVPPPGQVHPPGTRYTPPGPGTPPPGTRYTPPGTRYTPPPGTRYIPPGTRYTPPQG